MRAIVAVAAFQGSCPFVGAEESQWRVNFQKGSQKVESTAVVLTTAEGPVLVAVALQGADFPATSLLLEGKPIAAKFVGYDPVSKLCFLKPTEALTETLLPWAAKARDQGRVTFGGVAGADGKPGTLKGKVNRIGGKILPLALLKVQAFGKAPSPGAAVTGPDGKVLAIIFQAGDAEDEAYAIPAEAVHRVAKDILARGRLVKGWLGISLLVENSEPKVTKVWASSPAAEAGLQEGDLIARIGTTEVADYADVADAFFYLIPGESVELTVVRGGKAFRFALTPSDERPN